MGERQTVYPPSMQLSDIIYMRVNVVFEDNSSAGYTPNPLSRDFQDKDQIIEEHFEKMLGCSNYNTLKKIGSRFFFPVR